MTVRLLIKYLVKKLRLDKESEVFMNNIISSFFFSFFFFFL